MQTEFHATAPLAGPHLLDASIDSRRQARLLANCDVYLHAGDQEALGMGVLEAMACGTPVVVSAAGGVAELTQGAGLQVEGYSADRWAQAISASRDGGASSPLTLAALQRARCHDWASVLSLLVQRYERILQQSVRLPALHLAMEDSTQPAPFQTGPRPPGEPLQAQAGRHGR